MEIRFNIQREDLNKRDVVLNALRDAILGILFLEYKEAIDERYREGLISAGEYARLLTTAYGDALDFVEVIYNT